LFSSVENGLTRTTRRIEEIMPPSSGVVMDFPQTSDYTNCNQIYDNITFMCGKGIPNKDRFTSILEIDGSKENYFGYMGLNQNDIIKVFQKTK